ncbi:hypothetical protein ACFPRL_32300 [Pseudoclavibacter helvolus]
MAHPCFSRFAAGRHPAAPQQTLEPLHRDSPENFPRVTYLIVNS